MASHQLVRIGREALAVAVVRICEREDRFHCGFRVLRLHAKGPEPAFVVARGVADAGRDHGDASCQRLQDRHLRRVAQRGRQTEMGRALDLLDLLPGARPSHGEPRALPRELLESLQQRPATVDLERGSPPEPHPLDQLDRRERVLLAVEPADPDDPQRLVRFEPGPHRRRKLAERKRDVRGHHPVPRAGASDARAREGDRLREPQRRPRDEPLEQPAEHAVVEERARRERRPRAVQDEEDPLSAQARREGRDAREQVTRSVRDHDVGSTDLTPEQSPAADRKRPARRPEETRGNGHIGVRFARQRPAGEDANVPALSAEELSRDVHELLDASDAGKHEARDDQPAHGCRFPGVGAHATSAPRSRRGRGVPVFPRTRPPGRGRRRRRGRRRAGRGASHPWAHLVLPCWAIPMRCE